MKTLRTMTSALLVAWLVLTMPVVLLVVVIVVLAIGAGLAELAERWA